VNTDTSAGYATLKALPKIDLHRHLEGSLRLDTLVQVATHYRLNVPAADKEQLRPYVQITSDPPDHELFLSKFEVLRHFYRSPEIIKQLTYEAVADAAADNIRYLELRFSPQALARVHRFSLVDVTNWVIEAVQQASKDYSIEVGLIITLVRHDPLEQARQVAEIAFDYYGKGIVGLDLAGNEVRFPPGPFTPIFKKAKEVGLGVTVHAGEWASAHGVCQAVKELYADRIGHGVRIIEHSRILRLAKERDVTFEVCLTSNVQTGVVHDIQHHPLTDMLDLGLLATINTDDPRVSDCTLTDEYELAVNALGLGYSELRQMILNAANAAFLTEDGRKRLVAQFEKLLPIHSVMVPEPSAESRAIPFLHSPFD
jgi:adenosine deaminase